MGWRDRVGRVLEACKRTFGAEVFHTPAAGGGPHSRTGIFNDKYLAVDVQTGFMVSTSQPNLGIKLADWTPAPLQGDTLTIDANATGDFETYKVQTIEPDGEGGATLLLDQPI